MAGLSQSKEGGKAMADAAEKLSLFPDQKRSTKNSPPTADHLIAEEEAKGRTPVPQSSGSEPKAGSFEKLNAMFGGGAMFQLPPGSSS
jgi:hypothetical protein